MCGRNTSDTYTHMKTTVELSDDLLQEAKAVAARERSTVRALLEEGLRWALGKRRKRSAFKLRDLSVGGDGFQQGVLEGDWAAMRDEIYKGRGS